jgi:hypothetical protein
MKDSHDKRREADEHEAKKHLAEMAWVALLMAPRHVTDGFRNIAVQAWQAAEIMHDESEHRRPQE